MKATALLPLIAALLIGTANAYANAPDNVFEMEDISTLPLNKVREKLDENIAELNTMLTMAEKIKHLRIRISPAQTEEYATGNGDYPDNYFYNEPLDITPKAFSARLEESQKIPLSFKQNIAASRSLIYLNDLELKKLFGFPSEPNPIHYQLNTVYFRDGTQKDLAALKAEGIWQWTGTFNDDFELGVIKPIARIDLDIHYPTYPNVQQIVLSRDTPQVKMDNGTSYAITDLDGSDVSLVFSIPKSKDYKIQARDAAGKTLSEAGSSSATMPSESELKRLALLRDELIKTRKNFSKFADSKSVQTHLEQAAARINQQEGKTPDRDFFMVQKHMVFRKNLHDVVIFTFDKKEPATFTRQFTNQQPEQALYIAAFYIADDDIRYGLIDNTGQWVVKPAFASIDETGVASVYRAYTHQNDELIDKYIQVDAKTKKIKTLPFSGIDKAINKDLLIVQKQVNGPSGIYNLNTGQFVVPMKYVNIKVTDDVFTASLGDSTYNYEPRFGAFTLDNKQIIPPKYKGVTLRDDYFYVDDNNDRRYVFTRQGKNMTPKGYNAIGDFYQDQPLLIQHAENKRYHFMNKKGEILKIALPYDSVEPFSNGMAVVTKNEKRGAINLSGKLTVPLDYRSIYPFQKNLAGADDDRGLFVLIDRKGNIVKTLGDFRSGGIPYNRNDATYVVTDPDTDQTTHFDADGNIIPPQE